VTTRKVDDIVKALGADTGISKPEVSRICANLDEDVAAFRDRPLADSGHPYVFLDATYCKARVGRRVVSKRSSSRSGLPRVAGGKSLASRPETPSRSRSGRRSCVR
jgi:transposase-like protein